MYQEAGRMRSAVRVLLRCFIRPDSSRFPSLIVWQYLSGELTYPVNFPGFSTVSRKRLFHS
jgi:hypothetical protein